jgi:hypothetical protein
MIKNKKTHFLSTLFKNIIYKHMTPFWTNGSSGEKSMKLISFFVLSLKVHKYFKNRSQLPKWKINKNETIYFKSNRKQNFIMGKQPFMVMWYGIINLKNFYSIFLHQIMVYSRK